MNDALKLKVVVVEDELLVRVGIKSSIDWEANNLMLVGEAANGQEAIPLLRACHPDIVLLDIRLPDILGLDLLRMIRMELPQAKTIIISGLDDFETTREAFRLGAYEYFHKPRIQSGDLLKMLQNIRDRVLRETKSTGISENGSRRQALRYDVLSDEISDEVLRELTQEISMRAYLIMAVSLCGLYEKQCRQPGFNRGIALHSAENLITEMTSRRSDVRFLVAAPNEYYLLCCSDKVESGLNESAKNLFETLSGMLRRFINVSLQGGVSAIHYRFEELDVALQEARNMRDRCFAEEESFYFFASIGVKNREQAEISEMMEYLMDTIRNRMIGEHLLCMERLLAKMRDEGVPNRRTLLRAAQTFISFLDPNSKVHERGADQLLLCETSEQFLTHYCEILKGISMDDAIEQREGMVEQLKTYLKAHYAEEISLQGLSEEFHLSKSYISRAFKAETGTNLFSWLNEFRIKKSCCLLQGTKLKIYEIAEVTGFGSTVSFNYAFNRVMGISPSQYKEKIVGEKTDELPPVVRQCDIMSKK